MLRAIGYWTEVWRGVDQLWRADPIVIVNRLGRRAPEEHLISYLRGGHEFNAYRGFSWCRFMCGVDERIMGYRDLTDGVWVWPEGLVHYIEAHGLALPDEFQSHARSHHGVVPPLTDEIEMMDYRKREEVSEIFWNEWFDGIALRAG